LFYFLNNEIYLLDSLGNDRENIIPDGLKIQLSQIYGRNLKSISIIVPSVQKQTNSVDCGLFAIAFATHFCLNEKLSLDTIFDSKKLREHLLACFEDKKMSHFPTTSKKIGGRRCKQVKTISIDNYCVCNMPACLDNMVQCDKCNSWYHKYCVNAPADVSMADKQFLCNMCSV
jgi:hypothetical protein